MKLLAQAAHPLSRVSKTAVYGSLPAFVLVDGEYSEALTSIATSL